MKIKVCIAENSPICREGLKSFFNGEKNIGIVGYIENRKQLVPKTRKLNPDVILIDVDFLKINNLLDINKIRLILDYSKVVIMSGENIAEESIYKALKVGIRGWITHNASKDELLKAIKFVYEGKRYFHQEINNRLINKYVLEEKNIPEDPLKKLSDREKEVLEMVSLGKSSPEIAESLKISESTVKTYRQRFMEKLDLHNLQEIISFSIRNGIISI